MLFTKFIAPSLAFFSIAAGIYATPVAEAISSTELALAKRGSGADVQSTCQTLHDDCLPSIGELGKEIFSCVLADHMC